MAPFTLKDAKYCLVTYSQVPEDFDPWQILQRISELSAECIISKELHEDGGIHYHAFIDFGRKFSTRDTRAFDVCGRHPNIEKVGKTPWKAFDYVIKDGEVCYGGAERPVEGHNSDDGERGQAKWAEIVEAEDRSDFLERVRRLDPRALVCNWGNIVKYLDHHFPEFPQDERRVETFAGFNLDPYPGMLDWVDENLRGGVQGRLVQKKNSSPPLSRGGSIGLRR